MATCVKFPVWFHIFQSTADQVMVVFDRIASVFNSSGTIRAVAVTINSAFDMFWHSAVPHKLKSYGISVCGFSLFHHLSLILIVPDGMSLQEYAVNAGVPQGTALHIYHCTVYTDDTLSLIK